MTPDHVMHIIITVYPRKGNDAKTIAHYGEIDDRNVRHNV